MTSQARANPVNRGASVMSEREQLVSRLVALIRQISLRNLVMPLLIVLLAVVLVSPKGWLIGTIDHEIEQFEVAGELQNLDVKEIEAKLSAWLGTSFLMADLELIKADVESLQWVRNATVTRVWPGKLILSLTEQTPVAYWNEQAFLNSDGDVFSPDQVEQGQPLPLFMGPENSERLLRAEMLAEMAQLQTLLSPYLLGANALEVNERGSWAMTLNNGIRVALGSQPFEAKVERMATMLRQMPEQKMNHMESIDTRYPNGVAVKWKDVTIASRVQ